MAYHVGQKVEVQWRRGERVQTRMLIASLNAVEYAAVLGLVPPKEAEEQGKLWYALSPDGDISPHSLLTGSGGSVCFVVGYDPRGVQSRGVPRTYWARAHAYPAADQRHLHLVRTSSC